MAEPVVFGGSPLDQYLRDANSTEEGPIIDESSGPSGSEAHVAAARPAVDEDNIGFIEKFKYTICSSFLLTPSLSISFYESNPPFQTQRTEQNRATRAKLATTRLREHRLDTLSVRKQCIVRPADAPPGHLPILDIWTHKALPRLDARGQMARNAALLSAFCLLPPISKSWRLWLATSTLIASLVLGFIILFHHSSVDDTLEYVVSRQAVANASASTTSLRNLPTTLDFSSSERKALQSAVLKDVSNLIKAAQAFDISINKAISAIQEVEIVSRGYKITHPLPPISRIEAASSWSRVASPSQPRRTLNSSTTSTNGKLGRSLSGNGAPPVRRHAPRPLSLNLSNGRMSPLDRPSGRLSPAVSSDLGDLDLTQKMLVEQSAMVSAAGRPSPQRLVELRKSIVAALEEVGALCTSSTASLETLSDADEFALLHDLYALDASLQEDNDAELSHARPNVDASALPEGSPDLEHDRRRWAVRTPRKLSGTEGRSAELSGSIDAPWKASSSPQIGLVNHRRLSLVSDGGSVLDRQVRSYSSLSRRSSLASESGNVGSYRSPRLNYVSDRSIAASGPNESAAAKRLSYASNSNSSTATGLFDVRSPVTRNASNLPLSFTPPHSSVQTYSGATSPQSRATRHASILGPNSIFAHVDPSVSASSTAGASQALSLLSLKAKFEWMHKARRRWLCHLLALHLNMSGKVRLSSGEYLPCDAYWIAVRSRIEYVNSSLLNQKRHITASVAKEMSPSSLRASKDEGATTDQSDLLTLPHGKGDTVSSLAGHPGIEDRLRAMMLSLRSLQSKIRVCAEDIRVKSIPGLHGVENEDSAQALEAWGRDKDDAAIASQLETTLELMRDDLLGLSAEWEATMNLVQKEKRRSPSPQPSIDIDSDVSMLNAARDLVSPLEADEDDARSLPGKEEETNRLRAVQEVNTDNASDDDDDDGDLAALLLRSASPNSLPPPGLEQVFESIAGIAGLSGLGVAGSKLSRAERIEQARRVREEQQDRQVSNPISHRHSMNPLGIMSELNDVITSRKAVRDQRHQSALPLTAASAVASAAPPASSNGAPPALVLGSPLDLGSAEHDGVFGTSHSLSDARAMPRRSLSSLDLARARALQALEARSSSAASSSPSNSFDSGDESMLSVSDEFSFERTALESVPEDAASVLPTESPSTPWDSTSRKSTPKASQTPLFSSDATPVPDSPFDLGAQVAAYARRKKAAKAQAAAMQSSESESSMSSQLSQ